MTSKIGGRPHRPEVPVAVCVRLAFGSIESERGRHLIRDLFMDLREGLSLGFMMWVLIDGMFRITQFERGWPSLAALVLFVGAVQLISLGIIGEYLSRIFLEVKGRPAYLIARITNSRESERTRGDLTSGLPALPDNE